MCLYVSICMSRVFVCLCAACAGVFDSGAGAESSDWSNASKSSTEKNCCATLLLNVFFYSIKRFFVLFKFIRSISERIIISNRLPCECAYKYVFYCIIIIELVYFRFSLCTFFVVACCCCCYFWLLYLSISMHTQRHVACAIVLLQWNKLHVMNLLSEKCKNEWTSKDSDWRRQPEQETVVGKNECNQMHKISNMPDLNLRVSRYKMFGTLIPLCEHQMPPAACILSIKSFIIGNISIIGFSVWALLFYSTSVLPFPHGLTWFRSIPFNLAYL